MYFLEYFLKAGSIGKRVNPTAENIIKDFKDLTDRKAHKQIIENIHEALKEEFLEVQTEVVIMFSAAGADLVTNELEDDTEDMVKEEVI